MIFFIVWSSFSFLGQYNIMACLFLGWYSHRQDWTTFSSSSGSQLICKLPSYDGWIWARSLSCRVYFMFSRNIALAPGTDNLLAPLTIVSSETRCFRTSSCNSIGLFWVSCWWAIFVHDGASVVCGAVHERCGNSLSVYRIQPCRLISAIPTNNDTIILMVIKNW